MIQGNPLYEKGMVEWGEEQVKELVNARGETEVMIISFIQIEIYLHITENIEIYLYI